MSDLSLSEEFTASARAYQENSDVVSLAMLLTKYSVLQRHLLSEGSEKDSIAATLFDCGLKGLQAVAAKAPGKFYIDDTMPETFGAIFSKLLEPESANNIPAYAPVTLAQISLELLRKAEAAERESFLNSENRPDYSAYREYKTKVPHLAEIVLSFADKFKEAIGNSNANVTTAKPVTPSKVLQLKTPAQAT